MCEECLPKTKKDDKAQKRLQKKPRNKPAENQ